MAFEQFISSLWSIQEFIPHISSPKHESLFVELVTFLKLPETYLQSKNERRRVAVEFNEYICEFIISGTKMEINTSSKRFFMSRTDRNLLTKFLHVKTWVLAFWYSGCFVATYFFACDKRVAEKQRFLEPRVTNETSIIRMSLLQIVVSFSCAISRKRCCWNRV